MLSFLWLVPLLPLAGAAANGALGPRVSRKLTTAVALGFPAASLLLALGCLWTYLGSLSPQPFEQVLYAWNAGELGIDVAFLLDPLSAAMVFVVTFVGFVIHVYSVGYMAGDEGYQRYFVYLNLFLGAMLLLVLGNNFLITFVGWEGVGLCSYLLIGYYYRETFPPFAGKKAFLVNRVGDFAFLLGMFALVAAFGTLDYREIFDRVAENPELAAQVAPYTLGLGLGTFVTFCLFLGCTGKSAQIPLYVWLPDAMAGPTPVSALIHAATMVTAGVYIVARANVFYQIAGDVSLLVAVVGAATAIFAGTIGVAQNDIKKVLAYSTVSQLGYMFLAAGVGAYGAAIFHLATHAFFKALLFLGSGSVIHAMGGEQDMREMGGLKGAMPTTYRTFVIGSLALAGIPPLAGFFSKDAILAAAFEGGHQLLWAVGWITAGLTAFYMFRAVFLTFHGEFRGTEEQRHHLHESPPVMTVPLVVLAAGAVFAGFLGKIPFTHTDTFGAFLRPVVAEVAGHGHGAHHPSVGLELFLVGASVLVALAGLGLAWKLFGGNRGLAGEDALVARLGAVHRLLAGKYYVDEIYDRLIVRPLRGLARACWRVVDRWVIDGAVHAAAFFTELGGELGRFTTTGDARNYALYFFLGVLALFWWLAL